MTKHEIPSDILNSTTDEVLLNLPKCSSLRWCWSIRDHLFLYDPTLPGINRGLGLDHIVRMNGTGTIQVLEFISGLKRAGPALVELLDHSARLIEIFVDDALSATPDFLADPRHPTLPDVFRGRTDRQVVVMDQPKRYGAPLP